MVSYIVLFLVEITGEVELAQMPSRAPLQPQSSVIWWFNDMIRYDIISHSSSLPVNPIPQVQMNHKSMTIIYISA